MWFVLRCKIWVLWLCSYMLVKPDKTTSFLIQRNAGFRGYGMLNQMDKPSYHMCANMRSENPILKAVGKDWVDKRSNLKDKCSFYTQNLVPLSPVPQKFTSSSNIADNHNVNYLTKPKKNEPAVNSMREGLRNQPNSLNNFYNRYRISKVNNAITNSQNGAPASVGVRRLLNDYVNKIGGYQTGISPKYPPRSAEEVPARKKHFMEPTWSAISYGKLKIKVQGNDEDSLLQGKSTVAANRDSSFLNRDGDIFKIYKPAISIDAPPDSISFESLRFPGNFLRANVEKGNFEFRMDRPTPEDSHFNKTASFLIQRNTGIRGSGMLSLMDKPSYYMCASMKSEKPILKAIQEDPVTKRSNLKEICSFYIQKLAPLTPVSPKFTSRFDNVNHLAKAKRKESMAISMNESLQNLAKSMKNPHDRSMISEVNNAIENSRPGVTPPSVVRSLLNNYVNKIRGYQPVIIPKNPPRPAAEIPAQKKHFTEPSRELPHSRHANSSRMRNILFNPSPAPGAIVSNFPKKSLTEKHKGFAHAKMAALDFLNSDIPLKNDTYFTESILKYLNPKTTARNSAVIASRPSELTKMGPFPPVDLGDFSKQKHREPSLNIDGLVNSINVPQTRSNVTSTIPNMKGENPEKKAVDDYKMATFADTLYSMAKLRNKSDTGIPLQEPKNNSDIDQHLTMYYVKPINPLINKLNTTSFDNSSKITKSETTPSVKTETSESESNNLLNDEVPPTDLTGSKETKTDDETSPVDSIAAFDDPLDDYPDNANISDSTKTNISKIFDDIKPTSLSRNYTSENKDEKIKTSIEKEEVKNKTLLLYDKGENEKMLENNKALVVPDHRTKSNMKNDSLIKGIHLMNDQENQETFPNVSDTIGKISIAATTNQTEGTSLTKFYISRNDSFNETTPAKEPAVFDMTDPLKDLVSGMNSLGTNRTDIVGGVNSLNANQSDIAYDSQQSENNSKNDTNEVVEKNTTEGNFTQNNSKSNEPEKNNDLPEKSNGLPGKSDIDENSVKNTSETRFSQNDSKSNDLSEKSDAKIYSYNDDDGVALESKSISVFGNNDNDPIDSSKSKDFTLNVKQVKTPSRNLSRSALSVTHNKSANNNMNIPVDTAPSDKNDEKNGTEVFAVNSIDNDAVGNRPHSQKNSLQYMKGNGHQTTPFKSLEVQAKIKGNGSRPANAIEHVEFAKEIEHVEIAVSDKGLTNNVTKPVLAKSYVKDKTDGSVSRNATHTIDGNFVVKYDEPLSESTTREIANNIFKAVFNTLNKTAIPAALPSTSNGVERATIEKKIDNKMANSFFRTAFGEQKSNDYFDMNLFDASMKDNIPARNHTRSEEAKDIFDILSTLADKNSSSENNNETSRNEVSNLDSTNNTKQSEESNVNTKISIKKGDDKPTINSENLDKKEGEKLKMKEAENVTFSPDDDSNQNKTMDLFVVDTEENANEMPSDKLSEKSNRPSPEVPSPIELKDLHANYGNSKDHKDRKVDENGSEENSKIKEPLVLGKDKNDNSKPDKTVTVKGKDEQGMNKTIKVPIKKKIKSSYNTDQKESEEKDLADAALSIAENVPVKENKKVNSTENEKASDKTPESAAESTNKKDANDTADGNFLESVHKLLPTHDDMVKELLSPNDNHDVHAESNPNSDVHLHGNVANTVHQDGVEHDVSVDQISPHVPRRHTNHIITVKDDNEKETLLTKLVNYDYDKCVFMKLINDIKSPYRLISSVNRHGYKPRGMVFTLKTVLKDPDLHQFVAFRAIDENDPKRIITLDGQRDLVTVPVMCHGSPRIVHVESQQPPKAIANAMTRILSETRHVETEDAHKKNRIQHPPANLSNSKHGVVKYTYSKHFLSKTPPRINAQTKSPINRNHDSYFRVLGYPPLKSAVREVMPMKLTTIQKKPSTNRPSLVINTRGRNTVSEIRPLTRYAPIKSGHSSAITVVKHPASKTYISRGGILNGVHYVQGLVNGRNVAVQYSPHTNAKTKTSSKQTLNRKSVVQDHRFDNIHLNQYFSSLLAYQQHERLAKRYSTLHVHDHKKG